MSAGALAPPASSGAMGGGRIAAAVGIAALVGVVAATLLTGLTGGGGGTPTPVDRVVPVFEDGESLDSAWGSPERFGAEGSHILRYAHDTDVTFRIPFDGPPVVDARLGASDIHLLTVTEVVDLGDEVLVTVHRDNCRWFHEREIDIFRGITLSLANGGATEVAFDRPVFVKSPMLAGCPDRTIDRGDDIRVQRG